MLKVSQAVQGETNLEKLITAIMRLALEHAGAQRGLLISPQGRRPIGSTPKPRAAMRGVAVDCAANQ